MKLKMNFLGLMETDPCPRKKYALQKVAYLGEFGTSEQLCIFLYEFQKIDNFTMKKLKEGVQAFYSGIIPSNFSKREMKELNFGYDQFEKVVLSEESKKIQKLFERCMNYSMIHN